MVLLDTSVWIRFLAAMEPFAGERDLLLARDEVLGHDLVYGELLIGERGGRRTKLLAAYTQLHWAALVHHAEVGEFVRARKINGRGIGWIDAHLLASAMVERLYTLDCGPSIGQTRDGSRRRPLALGVIFCWKTTRPTPIGEEGKAATVPLNSERSLAPSVTPAPGVGCWNWHLSNSGALICQ